MGFHFVPQRYLKGFQSNEKPGWIWAFDKKRRISGLRPIKDVAQEADFYDPQVEVELNKMVEIPGGNVIDKIRRGESIDEVDRMHLTYYIATMIRRVPAARTQAESYIPKALEETVAECRQHVREGARSGQLDEAGMMKWLSEIDKAEEKFRTETPDQITQQIRTPWPFASMVVMIYRKHWRVLRCEGPSNFVTSDNPVHFFTGIGLSHIQSELTFPLCTDLLLHCSWRPGPLPAIHVARERQVKEFNRRCASGATRFAFYHTNAPWVLSVAENREEQLSVIDRML